jgi:transcriptional regulator with XRE-family HTH domain
VRRAIARYYFGVKITKGGFVMTGEKFKALRHFLNLTQRELAGKLGISRATIGRIECGSLQVTPRVHAKLARLDIDEDAFFVFYEKMRKFS